MNEQPHGKQKAIDGILHGGDMSSRHPQRPMQRRRFRAMAPASGRIRQPQPLSGEPQLQRPPQHTATASPHVQQAVPPVGPLSLDDIPAAPRLSRGMGKGRKRRGDFLRRKWQTIKGWSRRKKIVAGIITVLIIIGLIAGALFLKGIFNAKKVFKGGGSAVSLQQDVAPSLLKGEGDGRINILVLGAGGIGHEAPDLTDTIMVASIDPVSHKTALLSIPRDLWVAVPGHGSMKLNAVYETGKYEYLGKQDASNNDQKAVQAGFAMVDKTLEDVIGIPIHYHTLVNFKAFQQAVDSVGGISFNVPERLYDPTMAWQNNGSAVLAEAGQQTFDGRKALMYVRSRYTTSDFARSQRQRAVIVALQQKIFSLGTFSDPLKLSQLMDAFGNNVVSDLSISDLRRLYTLTKDVDPNTIASVGLTDPPNNYVTTGMVGNQSVVLPRAGLGKYDEIRSYVRNTLRDGYLAKENARVMVLNGTEVAGAATAAGDTLKSYGYNVTSVGDAPTKNYAKTTIVDLTSGKKSYTAQYLKKRYDIQKTVSKVPDNTIQTQNVDFVVILGADETSNSQN